MRKIKFRARSLEASLPNVKVKVEVGQWLYFTIGKSRETIGNVFWDDGQFHVHGYVCDFDTLGMYTSLKDKTGREIFEGDIVRLENLDGRHIDTQVVWCEKVAQYRLDPVPKFKPPYIENAWDLNRPLKVIGNIHENPELIGD